MIGSLGLSVAGCSSPAKAPAPDPEVPLRALEYRLNEEHKAEREEHKAERESWLAEKRAQQQEIERLQKLVAEKDAHIRSQQARQQDQAKTLQETSTKAAQAQVKLRRLATRPAAASAIAEVEMFAENLKSSSTTNTEQFLQNQAVRLLDAATVAYAEDNYTAAMDYAAQARQFIDIVQNSRVRQADQIPVSLQTPVPLRAIVTSNLRQKPGLKSDVLIILKKDSAMTGEAYQGDWLQVQTNTGHSGWVMNTLVEPIIGRP